MMGRDDRLGVDELPARPDPDTGLPWPPHGPGYTGGVLPNRWDSRDVPSQPPGHGRVFAWRPTRTLGEILAVAVMGFVIISVSTLTRGFEWMSYPSVWILLIFVLVFIYLLIRTRGCVAGADWFKQGRKWVETYELVEITYKLRAGSPRLKLQDPDGRKVTVRVKDLRSDRDVWDLVYNGILHSIVAGKVKTNEKLHLDLHVPRAR